MDPNLYPIKGDNLGNILKNYLIELHCPRHWFVALTFHVIWMSLSGMNLTEEGPYEN